MSKQTVRLKPGDLSPLQAGAGRGAAAVNSDLSFEFDGYASIRDKEINGYATKAIRPAKFLREFQRRFGAPQRSKSPHVLNLVRSKTESWEMATGHFDAVNDYLQKDRRAFQWSVDVQVVLTQGYNNETNTLHTRRRMVGVTAFPPESLQVDTETLRDVHQHREHMRLRDSYKAAPLRLLARFLEEEELLEKGELPPEARPHMISVDGLMRFLREELPKTTDPVYGSIGTNARVRFSYERYTALVFPLTGISETGLSGIATQWLYDVVEQTSGEGRNLWWDSASGDLILCADQARMVRRGGRLSDRMQ